LSHHTPPTKNISTKCTNTFHTVYNYRRVNNVQVGKSCSMWGGPTKTAAMRTRAHFTPLAEGLPQVLPFELRAEVRAYSVEAPAVSYKIESSLGSPRQAIPVPLSLPVTEKGFPGKARCVQV
jgi:hypothetical protein